MQPGSDPTDIVEDAVRTRLLRSFTERNAGRLTVLEEDGIEVGAQVEETSRTLRGVSYDPHGRVVTIMLGDQGTPDGHLTRSIPGVHSVDLKVDAHRRDSVLRIAHDGGQTLLKLVY